MQFDVTPYRFLEWREGFVCWDYVRLVLRDCLGATVAPAPEGSDSGPLAAARAMRSVPHRETFQQLDKPEPFCVVEMRQFKSPDHVGVYVIVDGKPFVTHCECGSGVLLSTLREIADSYQITGFYRYVG